MVMVIVIIRPMVIVAIRPMIVVTIRPMVVVAIRPMIIVAIRPMIIVAIRPMVVVAIRPMVVVAIRPMVVRFTASNIRFVFQTLLVIFILDLLNFGFVMIIRDCLTVVVVRSFFRMSTGAVTVGLMPTHGAQYIGQTNHRNA